MPGNKLVKYNVFNAKKYLEICESHLTWGQILFNMREI